MDTELPENIVNVVMQDLYGRGGFDHWWDSIDSDTQTEILESLKAHVESQLALAGNT